MDNSINFQGAFWLKQPTNRIQRNIKPVLGEGYKIIENFTSDGDVLYITEKNADKKVAKFLIDNKNAKFKYYKDLNTKSGFNVKCPDNAMKILSAYKEKIITTATELKRLFKVQKQSFNFSTRKKDSTLEKCMKTLKLDINDYNIVKVNGLNEIYTKDADKKLVGIISEPGQYGFRYARIEPMNEGDEVKRYAVKPGTMFTYINNPDNKIEDATTDFLKNYFKSAQSNRVTHNVGHQ